MKKSLRYLVGDFETTVYEGQERTDVWASALVEMYSEDVKIFHSIDETFEYLLTLDTNIVVYYHNLKFDGSFWLSFLMTKLKYTQAIEQKSNEKYDIKFMLDKDMPNKSFKYTISDMGQWYDIKIKVNKHIIEFRDSLKLLPFSVEKIGKSFKTKHRKLNMEYKGLRYAGCEITDEEQRYIANDVMVVKEALEIMFDEGHNKLTIGACCLNEFKRTFDKHDYKALFPDIYEIPIDKAIYGADNAGEYIRRSYKGGWCYLVKGKENVIKNNGTTADVNSLYPSMMSSESGNRYPVGKPKFWHGNYIPVEALNENSYFFVRVRTRFYIRENMLPCIQIKSNLMYPANEWLTSSDVFNPRDKKYYSEYIDIDGKRKSASVTLTLTMTDYALIKEHYELVDFEILDGCYFNTQIGLFDMYIEKYKKIKLESTGARRELAKLFLNNLYGKLASSTNSSFKFAYLKDEEVVGFVEISEYEKKAGYIPIGSAITSYARNFTIRAAQKNFHGVDKRGFIYADTDSIHCDLEPEEIKGITVHPKDFCCWKLEACWDEAIFTRQKTYIERVVKEDLQSVKEPYYNIKCAGMPEKCKKLFEMSMLKLSKEEWERTMSDEWEKLNDEERAFVAVPRGLSDFKIGLTVPGKLIPKRIAGGVLLAETTYEMR